MLTVKDLFNQVEFNDVIPYLRSLCKCDDYEIPNLRYSFEEMSLVVPKEDSCSYWLDIFIEEDSEFMPEVYGFLEDSSEQYSLLELPWSEWASCKISPLMEQEFSKEEMLAYILTSMTAFGYNDEDIRNYVDVMADFTF